MSAGVAYNPDDPLQEAFLNALALGETGGNASNTSAVSEGVGGTDLSSVISSGDVDAYGFPTWSGQGNSHAAGIYQFQPSTWDSIASEFGLTFDNSTDQSEGAWYLAEQADPNLESDLQSGNYSTIQSDLASIWPSVTGNAAAPQGLAYNLSNNVTANTSAATAQTAANNATQGGGTPSSGTSSGGGIVSSVVSALGGGFAQYALIIIGAVIIFVALWMLLSSTGYVPSPKQVGKSFLE